MKLPGIWIEGGMHTYTLHCEMWTSRSLRDTFALFEDPYNLAKITPRWLNFVVTSPKVQMHPGAEIDYTIRWLGIGMKWKTIIRDYTPPARFVDEQARGPYALWRHTHTFVETDNGTLVGDRVEYALPLSFLGRVAHAVMVKHQLLGIFKYRQAEIAKLLGGISKQTVAPRIES
jgi:ligand-binding SRPBCC domain-containing protein